MMLSKNVDWKSKVDKIGKVSIENSFQELKLVPNFGCQTKNWTDFHGNEAKKIFFFSKKKFKMADSKKAHF